MQPQLSCHLFCILDFVQPVVLVLAGIEFNFLPSSWYSGVVWNQDEKNIDNTRMFYLVLSRAHCNQGLLSVSCSASEQDTRSWEGAWPGHWSELAKGIFHNTQCHGQHRNWEGRSVGWLGAADHCLGMGWGQQVVGNCPVHHWFFLGYISFSFCWFPYHHHHHYISIIKLFLSQPRVFILFSDLPPHPTRRKSEWGAAWSLVVSWGWSTLGPSTSSNSLLPVSWLLLQPIWSSFSYCSVFPIPFAPEWLLLKL